MKSWYLIDSPTAAVSGYEDSSFRAFKNDYIDEILDTELATSVIKYNYDLSKKENIKAVIQDTLADTYLKGMHRTIITEIGTLSAGDYIYYEDEYWLVVGRPDNNKWYEKAVLTQCQHYIKWQNSDGDIITRWAHFSSASKYDVGESGTNLIYFASNNFIILLPSDAETMKLDGKRLFIDNNDAYDELPDRVFKITRNDDVLYYYHDHGGVLSLIADRDELNYETDNQELGICDYFDPATKPEQDYAENPIIYELHFKYSGKNAVISGGNSKTFYVYGIGSDGNAVSLDGLTWTVTTTEDNEDYITYEIDDDNYGITFTCAYSEDIIGTQFELTATVDDDHEISMYIEIGGGI